MTYSGNGIFKQNTLLLQVTYRFKVLVKLLSALNQKVGKERKQGIKSHLTRFKFKGVMEFSISKTLFTEIL